MDVTAQIAWLDQHQHDHMDAGIRAALRAEDPRTWAEVHAAGLVSDEDVATAWRDAHLQTMTEAEARAFRQAHDDEARALHRKPKFELVAIERSELEAQGFTRIYGGPHSKDELERAILEARYPLARLNEAIHVLGHANQIWTACEWCQAAEAAAAARPVQPYCSLCMAEGHFATDHHYSARWQA